MGQCHAVNLMAVGCPLPQAWYREGQAAEKLRRWEDAALGYYEAYLLQPENEDFALMMKHVINEGRREQGKGELGAPAAPACAGGS